MTADAADAAADTPLTLGRPDDRGQRGHVTVATLFPLTTVAAGDEANASALVRRGAARALTVEAVTVNRPEAFVEADVYLLGGTGRGGVAALVAALHQTDLAALVTSGRSVLLAVDAGLDAVSRSFVDAAGTQHGGLGLVPLTTAPAANVTGTVVVKEDSRLGLPNLLGWESNDVRTERHDGAQPFGILEVGAGDRGTPAADGVLSDTVIGTRLHGPLLALNPELADLVLARATGRTEPWPSLAAPAVERARTERIAEVRGSAGAGGWRSRLPARLR